MSQIHAEYQEVSREEYERKTRGWSYRFSLLPRRCMETGKLLWMKRAYRGRKIRRYDMDLFFHDKWMCREEFVKLRLLEKI
jgi:hypothetical protein